MAKNEGDSTITVTVSKGNKGQGNQGKQKQLGREQKPVSKAVPKQETNIPQLIEMAEGAKQALEKPATDATDAQVIEEWKNWLASVRSCSSAVRVASESLQKVDDGHVGKLMKMFESMSRTEAENLKRDVEQLKSKIRRLLK